MYTSSDTKDDGFFDDYISRGLCGTGPINKQEFSILDAVNIGLTPKPRGHCWICPLGCLFVPSTHPDREQVQATLLKFANKGSHPIYVNQSSFQLSYRKIHRLISIDSPVDLTEHIIRILHNVSMNILPDEVIHSIRNCDIIRRHEHINSLLGYTGTQDDLIALNMLSFLKSPPTEAFKDYNKRQIELGAAPLDDSGTSSPPPLFPPSAPSPSPCPQFISHPDGTILCVLNRKRGSMMVDTSSKKSLFRWVASDLHSQTEKAMFLAMVGTAFLSVPLNTTTCIIETKPDAPPFKRKVQYISFKTDFDDDNGLEYDTDAELLCLRLQHDSLIKAITLTPPPSPPQVIPNRSTIRAANYLLTLINQVPSSPPAQPPPLSPFNFSYIDATDPLPGNDPSPDPSARPSAVPILSPMSIPFDVPSINPRPAPISVSRADIFSLSSLVDVWLMLLVTMMILPSILVILIIIIPMMSLLLPGPVSATMTTVLLSSNSTTLLSASASVPRNIPQTCSHHQSSGRQEVRLQRWQCWLFIQKLHYSRIGSSCPGLQWIISILYKLSMTIWTLWQFHNDSFVLSTSAWRLLLDILQ